MDLDRRSLLAIGGAFLALPGAALSAAPLLAVPSVDRLKLTVLIDSTTSVFGAAFSRPDIDVVPPPITKDYHTAFAGQWGYSLLATSSAAGTARTTLIDFGYTPAALLNNMALLGIAPETIDAMVLSHGHYDHFGGLDGLLATGKVRRGTPLYVGGEEAFCARIRGTDADGSSFGAIDRPAILRAGVDLVVSGDPRIVAGQGFTTGRIPFVSSEHPRVPSGMLPGQNCARDLLDPAKRDKAFVVDDAEHELGTAYNVAGRGLVVIGSCSHRGIINTVRRAQAVSGIDKVHAIVGGFHLVPPQTREQAFETLALMQAINPDYIIPGHCTGETFIAAALAAMPNKVIQSIVGSSYIFKAA
ncbi:MBL fold metallo-hydrolase [Polymorphobacter megasporae]|uniref:MBL fold metallo-hydrolase n=1 Tax=Glacieibacterium megasporae TaxID=2835787 RepID=UPI001C1DD830|nr:MBL fold metallo-hydrolase [Polymorphobacter megasporae]UAJ09588.1 MBL fold metallo-hydrolase [Polymorphobacter megasporae]